MLCAWLSPRPWVFAGLLLMLGHLSLASALGQDETIPPQASETPADEDAGAETDGPSEEELIDEQNVSEDEKPALNALQLASGETDAVGEDEHKKAEAAEPETRDWGRLEPIANLVAAGGAVIVILIVLSIISLMVIVVKLVQFALLRVGTHRFTGNVADMLADGRDEEALGHVARRRGVVARVMEAALRGKAMGASDEIVKQEVERVAKAKLDGLERGLPLLSLIATISPLLGLLGTVLGMIEAFQQLEGAGDRVDPAILSGGIWEALLTTAAGLSVAIPAAAFFTWLQRSVDVAAQHMEDAATRVFTAPIYKGRTPTIEPEA